MPKTGTTAIQKYLEAAPVEKLHLPYPNPSITLLFADEKYRQYICKRLNLQEREALPKIRMAINNAPSGQLHLSSEFIFEAAIRGNLERFREELSRWRNVRVILFLRHPADHVVSLASQKVKAGATSSTKAFTVDLKMYQYTDLCCRLAKLFDLTVLDYGSVEDNVVPAYCQAAGIDYDVKLISPERINPSLRSESFAIAQLVNNMTGDDLLRREIINRIMHLDQKSAPIEAPEQSLSKISEIDLDLSPWLAGPLKQSSQRAASADEGSLSRIWKELFSKLRPNQVGKPEG